MATNGAGVVCVDRGDKGEELAVVRVVVREWFCRRCAVGMGNSLTKG